MKALLMLFIACALMGCTRTTELSTTKHPKAIMEADYPIIRTAPEIIGEVWINADGPLHMKDLQGKVVLIEMWTYG